MKTEEPQEEIAPGASPQSKASIWAALSTSTLVRFLLLFASGWAAVQLLAYFEVLIVVFVTATILAFLLNHPVTWLSRWLPRGVAAIAVFLTCLAIIVGLSLTLGMAVLSQGQQLSASVQNFSDSVIPWLSSVEDLLETLNLPVDLQGLEPQLQNQTVAILTTGLGLLQSTLANLVLAVLIAVVTLFMMLDGAKIWWWLLNNLPIRNKVRFNTVIQHNLLGFFWGRLLLAVFSITSTFAVFAFLGMPFPLVLAVIAGLFNLIPGIGATLGISIVSLLLLSQGVWLAIQAVVVCIAVEQIEENLLLPYIMKDSLDINPVVMFFALIVGATVAGVLGLFLAVPIAGVIVTCLDIEAMRGKPTQD
ncbi:MULTISPECIES: AI-2E family transporter [Cyanophyceae]|uniref:AI-2E family transporter n=1 Tax=Leptolyngbya subtilissima DQ-A4 TaxID=2933933 RepID=A0ABV0K1T1_9CYAN|nr:AI-2E family transporter [Nodosilinea sp. FACHB-141]MBD2111435.1 AI-2E family transporter [Nodosilinea sp. FACHB-141]